MLIGSKLQAFPKTMESMDPRSKEDFLNGQILLLDKPLGWSSFQVVNKVRWTLRKKFEYMNDSIFAFTDLPVRMLTRLGVLGLVVSLLLGFLVIVSRVMGAIEVPGYTMTILVLMFFGALNLLGLGIVGSYAWRAYENSKRRPDAILATRHLNFEVD